MRRTLTNLCAVGALLVLVGAGCSSQSTGPDGGVYRSYDKGTTWEAKNLVLTTSGQKATFGELDINVLAQDPTDPKALWAGTMANGILYTYDNGESWNTVKLFSPAEIQLTSSRVNGIAVDPTNSCLVYATISSPNGKSYLVRTINCGRSWGLLYPLEATETQLQAIAVNPLNHLQLFLGNTAGDVFRSDNGGTSWVRIARFEDHWIRSIVPSPKKDGVVYLATKGAGLQKSVNGGQTWSKADLRSYEGTDDVYVIALNEAKPDSLLIGTRYGILRTNDGGTTWEPLQLLTAAGSTQIISLAINQKNPNVIYYGTPLAFYRSEDGGKSWTSKRVPSTRFIKALVVNNQKIADTDTEVLWFAAWRQPQ